MDDNHDGKFPGSETVVLLLRDFSKIDINNDRFITKQNWRQAKDNKVLNVLNKNNQQ